MRQMVTALGAALLAAAITSPASATLYNFVITGSQSATFQLGGTPSSFTTLQTDFTNVSGTFGGVAGVASLINFSDSPGIASINIVGTALGFEQLSGDNLFTGPTSAPVFNIGSFTESNPFAGITDTFTITQVAAVPEPSTWAMMILGFCGVGFMAYRRKRTSTAFVAA